MRAAERGLLMLTCSLGDSAFRPLSMLQYLAVGELLRRTPPERSKNETLCEADLIRAGVGIEYAQQIVALLNREERLNSYLDDARKNSVQIITALCPNYPAALKHKLGDDAPPVLFCKGNLDLLHSRCVSLVGSRQLGKQGKSFSESVGFLAAETRRTLVSGGAAGADRTGQDACLLAGGNVLVFTPDRLDHQNCGENVLLVSECGFRLPFSAERALARNRLIHAMGEITFVAQCTYRRGGTWRGSVHNLQKSLSPLCVCNDGTHAASELIEMGATGILTQRELAAWFNGS